MENFIPININKVPFGNQYDSIFIDIKSTALVDYALDGLIESNDDLVLLEGHRVVLRRDYKKLNHVKILSGGFAGFEPLFTGSVGKGMLTGVVIGDSFTSPSYASVYAAIMELDEDNPFGVLFIVMYHPSLRLNFILAVEKALRSGANVKYVFVRDDCSGTWSSDDDKSNGSCGTCMVIKVAAAMAEQNKTLEEIYRVCSSEMSLSTINLNFLIGKDNGIVFANFDDLSSLSNEFYLLKPDELSGSSGSRATSRSQPLSNTQTYTNQFRYSTLEELAETVLGFIVYGKLSERSVTVEPGSGVALLFNNYGYMNELEMLALVNEVCLKLRERKLNVVRVYVGTLMMTRICGGLSVTALIVDETILNYLDHPCSVKSWPVCFSPHRNTTVKQLACSLKKRIRGRTYYSETTRPEELGPIVSEKGETIIRTALEFVVMALISCEDQINSTGMYYYGTNIKHAAENINRALDDNALLTRCPYALLQQLGQICSHINDVAGSHYAIFFDGASQEFSTYFNQSKVTYRMWRNALERGIKAIEFYTDDKKREKNMLNALYPMLEVMKRSPKSYVEIAEAAELGDLKMMLTSWSSSLDQNCQSCQTPDSGSHTVSIWARAAVEALNSCKSSLSVTKNYPSDTKVHHDDVEEVTMFNDDDCNGGPSAESKAVDYQEDDDGVVTID